MESRLIWPVACTLGEGPLWHDDALWFVDIKGGAIHRYRPATDARDSFEVGGRPSFIVPVSGGDYLVGDGDALRPFDGGTLGAPLARVDMPGHNRTNDATVDAAGRLWFGTMDDGETQLTGAVHRFDADGIADVGGSCSITNGPAISPDGRHLYHVDTLGRGIWRFTIADDGTLVDRQPFTTVADADGYPDGIVVDAEGCVWLALWGGWQVRRYAPDGHLLATVALPCANVTKIALGGPDRRTAYVTTARAGLDAAALADQPLAGGLFAFDAPAPGLAANAVKLA